MALKITRPYFANRAKGSLFPGFRLTTSGETGTLAPLAWPPAKVKRPAGAGAPLLSLRAKVRLSQKLYRLDNITNATQQAARSSFPATAQRIAYHAGNARAEWAPMPTPRTLHLAHHHTATPTDHTAPL